MRSIHNIAFCKGNAYKQCDVCRTGDEHQLKNVNTILTVALSTKTVGVTSSRAGAISILFHGKQQTELFVYINIMTMQV